MSNLDVPVDAGDATPRRSRRSRRLVGAGLAVATTTAGFLALSAGPADATPTIRLRQGVVKVTATNGEDQVLLDTVTGTDGITRLHVTLNTSGSTLTRDFDLAAFTIIQVNALNGNDEVTVQPAATLESKTITVIGQGGDDVLNGGRGAETFLGGSGDDFVVGGRGADRAVLGAGDDEFVWNQGDGSDTVEGREDDDTLTFNGAVAAEGFDLSANGSRLRFFRDLGSILMDVNQVENVVVDPGPGADRLVVHDLAATDVVNVEADFDPNIGTTSNTGDGQVDRLTVEGDSAGDEVGVTSTNGTVQVAGFAAFVQATAMEPTDELQVIPGADDVVDTSGVVPGSVTIIP